MCSIAVALGAMRALSSGTPRGSPYRVRKSRISTRHVCLCVVTKGNADAQKFVSPASVCSSVVRRLLQCTIRCMSGTRQTWRSRRAIRLNNAWAAQIHSASKATFQSTRCGASLSASHAVRRLELRA
jgi:hypothetical protein